MSLARLKSTRGKSGGFWSSAITTTAGIALMGALALAAAPLYKTTAGRYPATLIGVMRSREMLDNAGVRGYYERLLGKYGTMERIYNFDRSFRKFRFKPNLTQQRDGMTTNSFGMIGPERSIEKPDNTRRIALLGASLTSGQNVKAEETYGALLENRLNRDKPNGYRYEVLNFACISYTLPQIADSAIEDAARFHPDVYLLDLNELAVSTEWARHLVQITEAGIDPKYEYIRDVLLKAGVSASDSTDVLYSKLAPYRIPALRGALLAMKDNAERNGAGLIAMLMPSVEAGDLSRRRLDSVHDLLAGLGVPVIDLLDTYDSFFNLAPLAAYTGDIHPNRRGHELIFENLYRKLKAQPTAWAWVAGPPRTQAAPLP